MTEETAALVKERQMRSRRIRRRSYLYSAVSSVVVLAAMTLVFFGPGPGPSKAGIALMSVGLVILLTVIPLLMLLLPGYMFLRHVAEERPEDVTLSASGTAETVVALREIVPGFDAGMLIAVAIGPDAIRLWGRPTPTPDVAIAFGTIRRCWLDVIPVTIGTGLQTRTTIWSVVVFEFRGGDDALHTVPLVPSARRLTFDRNAGVDRLVEALNARTALPWLDAPPGDDRPDTTTAPEAEATGAVESSEPS